MTGDRSSGALRQARYRERRREAQAKHAELVELGRSEARQAGLPLAPVTEMDDEPPQAGLVVNGRPAGSVARSTAEMQRFMLTRYRSPLVMMAEVAARPARDLAEDLSCTPAEAFAFQLRMIEALAPYLHSKMPAAVQVDGTPQTPIVVTVSGAMASRMGLAQSEQNQDVDGGASA